jgi:hypothetical protein
LKKNVFVSEISADPQKHPYGVKGVCRKAKNGQKVFVKFDTKLLKIRNRAKKTRTRVSEDFLGLKVTTPQILGSAEILAGLGVFFKICSCQLFFKKNLVTFYCCFFQFSPRNYQQVKVNNLTGFENFSTHHVVFLQDFVYNFRASFCAKLVPLLVQKCLQFYKQNYLR